MRAARLEVVLGAAERYSWNRRFDVCLFLSLYHHYDRLGPEARQVGDDILRMIGRQCQTLFFETGQTDDTVAGAAAWRDQLAMSSWPTPEAWLEAEVPRLTGYRHWRCLGTSAQTQRKLYVFWHRPTAAAGAFPALRHSLARGGSPRRRASEVVLWDARACCWTGPAPSASTIVREFLRRKKPGDHLLLDRLAQLRALPRGIPSVQHIPVDDVAPRARLLASLAYAGSVGVVLDDTDALSPGSAALARALDLPRFVLPPDRED